MLSSKKFNCNCFNEFKHQEIDFIKEYKYWLLYLHFKQYFWGRSLLILKKHKTNLCELTKNEILEQQKILVSWQKAIEKINKPYNYTIMLSNTEKHIHHNHIHWHLIPRHNNTIIIDGRKYPGESKKLLTLPYYKTPDNKIASPKVRLQIKKIILKNLP